MRRISSDVLEYSNTFWLGMFATNKAGVESLVKQGTPVESNYTYAL
jgi:hypothetical protein